jgi:hypothetical protein
MLAPRYLVIITFLLIVATPALVQVAVEATRGERPDALRILTRLPTATNLRDYEKSLQNDSVTARALRPLVQATQFFAFRDAGDKALTGPQGWLFYQPGVSSLTQRARPADSTVKDAVAAVVRYRDDLASRGVRLIVLPAPNKESVYPDQLAWFAMPPEGAIGDETRAFLAESKAAGVEVVDLFALFAAARRTSSAPLYLEQDSHWSPIGMEMAASAVARRILERCWLTPGSIKYVARSAPVREIGDLVRMIRSPQIEARVKPEAIATSQVVRRDTGLLYTDDPTPEVLVLGDSFMRIYQYDPPEQAGFIAHLALALGCPIAGIVSDGGASTLVRQDLFRRPKLLSRAKIVVWEFVERDIRLGAEGWQIVPLPSAKTSKQTAGIRSAPHAF